MTQLTGESICVWTARAPKIVDDTLTKRSEKMKNSEIRKRHSLRETVDELVDRFGNRFSTELGITLEDSSRSEVFKWFLASILFGARISEKIAVNTYYKFAANDLTTPKSIVKAGWDRLVEVLDSGGYARYDFKTATKLLEVVNNLERRYQGDLNRLYLDATTPGDLEAKIKELGKGIGDVTASIFLRELRGIWGMADPPLQELAIKSAESLGLTRKKVKNDGDKRAILRELQNLWVRSGVKGRSFTDFEVALVRYGKDVLRKRKC